MKKRPCTHRIARLPLSSSPGTPTVEGPVGQGIGYRPEFASASRLAGIVALLLAAAGALPLSAAEGEVVRIDGRRQLLVDDFLIAKKEGVELRLHSPIPREIVLVRGAPWEGSGCGVESIFRDGDVIRMYYIGADLTTADGTPSRGLLSPEGRPAYACYAESNDGIHWVKPDLGQVEFNGSKHNNILFVLKDNFTPFKDPNPDCRPDEKYKSVGSGPGGLFAFKSADGIHWKFLQDKPIITQGAFDTQNNAFWDAVRGHYWCYVRGFHKPGGNLTYDTKEGIRDIRVATSADFRTWTEPRLLQFPDSPDEQLYTNQVQPYYRAPDLFVGFPTRYIERKFSPAALQALPDPQHRLRRIKLSPRYGMALTDGLFMSSRDGRTFNRWDEPFLPAGPERRDNWLYGDCYQSLGMLETPADDPTAPPELSIYFSEGEWKGPTPLRRYTIRIDGFVSLHARRKGGEFVTRPLIFSGDKLTLNFATSAAGKILVELETEAGAPVPGFSMAECDELFGDTLDRTVTWRNKADVRALAGKPIRIRMTLGEADLYSLRFEDAGT